MQYNWKKIIVISGNQTSDAVYYIVSNVHVIAYS